MSERVPPSLPPELGGLSTFIDSHIECLAGCDGELRSIALRAAKHIFDWALRTEKTSKPHIGALLATLTDTIPPQTRSKARSTQSPRQEIQKKIDTRETPLPSLIIEDMNMDQIWQQLDLRAIRVCENLQVLLGENPNSDGEDSDEIEDESEDKGEDEGEDEDEDEDRVAEMDIDDDGSLWEELGDAEEHGSSIAEGVNNFSEDVSDDDEDHEPKAFCSQKPTRSGSYVQAHSELNDGFFDLATFNAETNEVRGKEVYKRKLDFTADEDSTEESEVDLFGSVDDSVAEGVDNGPEPFYNDFFEPPSAKRRCISSSKVRFHERVFVKKIKPVGKGMPVSSMDDEASEEEENNFVDDGNDGS